MVVVDDRKLVRNLARHGLGQAGHEVESRPPSGCRMQRPDPDQPVVVLSTTHVPSILESLKSQADSRIHHKPLREWRCWQPWSKC